MFAYDTTHKRFYSNPIKRHHLNIDAKGTKLLTEKIRTKFGILDQVDFWLIYKWQIKTVVLKIHIWSSVSRRNFAQARKLVRLLEMKCYNCNESDCTITSRIPVNNNHSTFSLRTQLLVYTHDYQSYSPCCVPKDYSSIWKWWLVRLMTLKLAPGSGYLCTGGYMPRSTKCIQCGLVHCYEQSQTKPQLKRASRPLIVITGYSVL